MNNDQLKKCQGEYQIENNCFIGELMLAIIVALVFMIVILGFSCCYITCERKFNVPVNHIQDTDL